MQMFNDKAEIVPDKLNETPNFLYGMCMGEFISVYSKVVLSTMLVFALIGLIGLGELFWAFTLAGTLGIGVGAGLATYISKNIIAPRKAGKPYGYYFRKRKLNSIWFKLGVTKVRTIHRSGLWRHFK